MTLNILFVPCNTEEIRVAYKLKYNRKCDNQAILLIIIDGEKWHYLSVKNLSRLLKGTASNLNECFYCLNCSHSYSTKNRLVKHERVCNDHDYCHVEMPNEGNKILKYSR